MKQNEIRFALIGDCHYSFGENYGSRDCKGAKTQLTRILKKLNRRKLDFVISLGDLGDGHDLRELPEMLEAYKTSSHPVYFTVGNHDLVMRQAHEYAEATGMPAPFYTFSWEKFRFIVLNAFEQSRYCPHGSEENKTYRKFRDENPWLRVQEWPGLMKEESWATLKQMLDDSVQAEEQVILVSHVPVQYGVSGDGVDANGTLARTPDFQRMLDLLDEYSNVRAYFAGHYHPGGIAVRNGVLHKIVKSVCDYREPTACIVTANDSEIRLTGIGAESDFVHSYSVAPSYLSGTAPAGCWVMTNCGEIAQVGKSGKFCLHVPSRGKYCIKAVMDGCKDVYLPHLTAPARGLNVTFTPDPSRKLYTGKTNGPALLHITDDGKPVLWFDVAGTEYGSIYPEKPMWVEHSNNFWTNGRYAFTAKGKVEVRELPKHPALRKAGWFKGDLHAHLIHGENLYIGNVQESAFIGRAENYDWLYLAAKHGNDDYPTDGIALAKALSGPDFLLGLNQEFPKARSNHFGNLGAGVPGIQADMTQVSSLEIAERYVWDRGGITVPVHPFYGHMAFRELALWIRYAPEKLMCMDFFYDDNFPRDLAENYWFKMLNKGYRVGCFATSDAAFDVGRTPASGRGATYLRVPELTERALIEAIQNRRTMVSWDCAALLVRLGEAEIGDILPVDGEERTLKITAYWQKKHSGILRVVRNGVDVHRVPVQFTEDETPLSFTFPVKEVENAWYVVILESDEGRIRSVTSPIWFRTADFEEPKAEPRPESFSPELLAWHQSLTPEEVALLS